MSKYQNIGKGENCPKCGKVMDRRKHQKIPTKGSCYFSEWDFCSKYNNGGCGHVQHYEKYKISL